MDFDSLGNVYVLDWGYGAVHKYDHEGNLIEILKDDIISGGYPISITIDNEDNAYLIINNSIVKYDKGWNFIKKWGQLGSLEGEFHYPIDIKVDNEGNIYVLDTDNHRIQKFDSDGNFLTEWEGGWNILMIEYPGNLAIDSEGNVFEISYSNIRKYNPNGEILQIWDNLEYNISGHCTRFSIAIDSDDYFYTTNSCDFAITKWDSMMNMIERFGMEEKLPEWTFIRNSYLAINNQGIIYMSDRHYNRVRRFNLNGTLIETWKAYGNETGIFNEPFGIALDENQDIYVVDSKNRHVQKFDKDGKFIKSWGGASTEGLFRKPRFIATDNEGFVYVTDIDRKEILKFDSEGNFILNWSNTGYTIAINNQNIVFSADCEGVKKYSTEGKILTFSDQFDINISCSTYPPITTDVEGNIYLFDTLHGIEKFDPDGNNTSTVDIDWMLNISWGVHGTDWGLNAITVDQEGLIYVSFYDLNDMSHIFILNQKGELLSTLGTLGPGNGELKYPSGIAVDSSGNVYISDTFNYRVQKFRRIKNQFVRGNPNEDGLIDIADVIYILNYLFTGGEKPVCMDSADANDDGEVNISDPVYILRYLFADGREIPEPFPDPGDDPTPDEIVC